MFGLGITNNPQPYPSTTTTTSMMPTHHHCTITITSDHNELQPSSTPTMHQHHQNDVEMPCHQPQQENQCPPHQHDTMTMVTMQDDSDNAQHHHHLWFSSVNPGESNRTPPPIFLFTQNPGTTSQSAMWQPNNEQWPMLLFIIIGWTQHNNRWLNNYNAMWQGLISSPLIPAGIQSFWWNKIWQEGLLFFSFQCLLFQQNLGILELRLECSTEFAGMECNRIWLFVCFTPVTKQTTNQTLCDVVETYPTIMG